MNLRYKCVDVCEMGLGYVGGVCVGRGCVWEGGVCGKRDGHVGMGCVEMGCVEMGCVRVGMCENMVYWNVSLWRWGWENVSSVFVVMISNKLTQWGEGAFLVP